MSRIKGLDTYLGKIEKVKREFPKRTGQFLMLQAEQLKADTKDKTNGTPGTPVDSGNLRNGWQRKNGKKETGNTFSQIVYNNVEYVNHVEFGHRAGRSKTHYVKGVYMLKKAILKRKLYFYKNLDNFYKRLVDK